MEIEFKMPDLATTDSTIKVIRWLVEPGQPVTRGQSLLEVETDKATLEVESIATGRLVIAHARPGDALLAGQLLAVLEVEGGPAPSAPPAPMAQPAPAPAAAAVPAPRPAGGMFAKNRAASRRPAP
jgi:pyruvate/2-oxoglutarate dehydrogenase complex dihydrolipoamide acyltransferase (E2) component